MRASFIIGLHFIFAVPSNATLYALWKDQKIYVNGTLIHNTFQKYYLQSYLMLLTQMSQESIAKWEIASYFDDQSLNQLDPRQANGGKNGVRLFFESGWERDYGFGLH